MTPAQARQIAEIQAEIENEAAALPAWVRQNLRGNTYIVRRVMDYVTVEGRKIAFECSRFPVDYPAAVVIEKMRGWAEKQFAKTKELAREELDWLKKEARERWERAQAV